MPKINKINISIGCFPKKGNTIFQPSNNFLIVSRSAEKQTAKKTSFYLLSIDSETGKRSYVSSLYPTKEDNTYEIEYQRERYIVSVSDSDVTFSEVNSYVYNRELVPKNGNPPLQYEVRFSTKKEKK